MAKCKHCESTTDSDGELCHLCLSVGVHKLLCGECGRETGDWGFEGEDDGARCDDCVVGGWL